MVANVWETFGRRTLALSLVMALALEPLKDKSRFSNAFLGSTDFHFDPSKRIRFQLLSDITLWVRHGGHCSRLGLVHVCSGTQL